MNVIDDLEDLDDHELDSYIVSEDEFEQKKKAWLKLYSDFLEEQKSEPLFLIFTTVCC